MRYKIFRDGELVNTIVADESFVESYCSKNGCTYEAEIIPEPVPADPEPTTEERIEELEAMNAELENAMCEMDAANEERFAAIEDALCEMDMG